MNSEDEGKNRSEVRVELKYCEHCGGLWVRERGAGVVFCEKCQPKVEDMPIGKKRPGRVRLPAGPRQDERPRYRIVFEEGERDIDAVGGVA